MLEQGFKSFLIVFAASSASAVAVTLMARAAAVNARFDGEWRHLDTRWRHHVLIGVIWGGALFIVVVPLIEPPMQTGQYVLWTIFILGASGFAVFATYQAYLTRCQWNGHELRVFSWLLGWRFVLLDELNDIKLTGNGYVIVTTRWGESLRFDSSLDGAPDLIETCRRHIAANTKAAAAPAAFGSQCSSRTSAPD